MRLADRLLAAVYHAMVAARDREYRRKNEPMRTDTYRDIDYLRGSVPVPPHTPPAVMDPNVHIKRPHQ
jgi:hypothetical protein